MKTQALLLALAATLNLAVADVANVADIANVANIAAADVMATVAVTADEADVPEFWDWTSDDEWEDFGKSKGKKDNNRKRPPRPVKVKKKTN